MQNSTPSNAPPIPNHKQSGLMHDVCEVVGAQNPSSLADPLNTLEDFYADSSGPMAPTTPGTSDVHRAANPRDLSGAYRKPDDNHVRRRGRPKSARKRKPARPAKREEYHAFVANHGLIPVD
ncbi:hypothetical protein MW887_009331 [Aspergillus wentii]|nr:hypothetical protein MW887_009331 [Aspergillus wentii]